jgi:V-type H+-transporting ATPase subunit a
MFACATFPFLFGVMFGDIMHGLLFFLFAAYLCFKKDQIIASKSALAGFVKIRYILLLMGFFGCYNGFIYNDMMAIPLNIVPSCFKMGREPAIETVKSHDDYLYLYISEDKDCIHHFGIDQTWYLAPNSLTYMNNFKMKLSVIFGVLQMGLGICMKAANASYFGHKIEFYFEFIPQITLLLALFGWMDLMIIVKWLTPYHSEPEGQGQKVPAIITQMVNMFLKGGATDGDPLIGTESTMKVIQTVLLCNLYFNYSGCLRLCPSHVVCKAMC